MTVNRNSTQQISQVWDGLVDWYQENFMDLELYQSSYLEFLKFLKQDHPKVLELGCGPGVICHYLLSIRSDLQITGTDLSETMVSRARKNVPMAKFSCLDARDLLTLNTTFDAILGGFVLPYLNSNEVKKLINDSFQTLHSGGILYLSFVEGNPDDSYLHKVKDNHSLYFFYHQANQISSFLKENSFEILSSIDFPYLNSKNTIENHKVLIARK